MVWYGAYSGSTAYAQIRYRKYTTSWQTIENLTNTSSQKYYPNLIWANWPEDGEGRKTNVTIDGYGLIYRDATTVMFYKSSDFLMVPEAIWFLIPVIAFLPKLVRKLKNNKGRKSAKGGKRKFSKLFSLFGFKKKK